jgi:hypothetical protein
MKDLIAKFHSIDLCLIWFSDDKKKWKRRRRTKFWHIRIANVISPQFSLPRYLFAFPVKWDAFVRIRLIGHAEFILSQFQRDNLLSIVSLEHCVATHRWIANPITIFRGNCVEWVLGKCYLPSHFFSTPASSTVYFQRPHCLCTSTLVV